jgi:outer membrane protein OmpA-like peptidoglycan-associated protein
MCLTNKLILGIIAAMAAVVAQPAAAQAQPAAAQAQEPDHVSAEPDHIVERSDFSRWVDGAYVGHAWGETRTTLEAAGPGQPGGTRTGTWYLLEETLRDLRAEARGLDLSGRGRYSSGALGCLRDDYAEGSGGGARAPSLQGLLDIAGASYPRGFPAGGWKEGVPASDNLIIGASFVAPGTRLVNLRGQALRLPFLAEYRVTGRSPYLGRDSIEVRAKFATRLQGPVAGLAAAKGSHDLDIRLDAHTGAPIFLRDSFDETFGFAQGGSERRSGSNLVFWKGGDGGDRGSLVAILKDKLGALPVPKSIDPRAGAPGIPPDAGNPALPTRPAPALPPSASPPAASGASLSPPPLSAPPLEVIALAGPDLEVAEGEGGVVLRILDLRFRADSAELLPGESGRLDTIAKALLAAPGGRSFLVEGHAASAGKPQGELDLSKQRAKTIVDALSKRGIPASRFIWRGLGSSRPIAPNTDDQGRARNRRVEITILD